MKAIWNAVFDLRNYFEKKSGRPHMGLLGRLFYPNENEDTFTKEWHERKDWFKDEKGMSVSRNSSSSTHTIMIGS